MRTSDGHFWLVDEYGPSIVEVDAAGRVVERHVPEGLEGAYDAAGVDYPVTGSLPSALAQRRANRGFEDVALLPDGHTIVVALQELRWWLRATGTGSSPSWSSSTPLPARPSRSTRTASTPRPRSQPARGAAT